MALYRLARQSFQLWFLYIGAAAWLLNIIIRFCLKYTSSVDFVIMAPGKRCRKSVWQYGDGHLVV